MKLRPIASFLAWRRGALLPAVAALCLAAGAGPGDGGGFCYSPATSGKGRFVSFYSLANNLSASADTNDKNDVFVRDTKTGTTTLDSVATGGAASDGDSFVSAVSADGRWLVFASEATDLVAGDTNASRDIFLRDRKLGTTTLVSVNSAGAPGDGDSDVPALSANGRFVAFASKATDLVAADTNAHRDVFVRDLKLGLTERVSVASDGSEGTGDTVGLVAISPNGRWVAFSSTATNLVTGDSNGNADVFLHDRKKGTTTRVSVATGGVQTDGSSFEPCVSNNGRWVSWDSDGDDLVAGDTNGTDDMFVHDVKKNVTVCASVAPDGTTVGDSYSFAVQSLSADGRWLAFQSHSTNLVTGDTNLADDIFLRDLKKGVTTRISVATDGTESDGFSTSPSISNDGRNIAFVSVATTLAPGSSNGKEQIFVHDRKSGATTCASVSTTGELADTVP